MLRHTVGSLLVLLLLGGALASEPALALADKPSPSPYAAGPIEADLPQALSADHLVVGSSFVLRVIAPWEHGGCRLVPGTLVHASVSKASRDAHGHTAELAFNLTLPCGETPPVAVVVASLIAPPIVAPDNQALPSFFEGLGGKQDLAKTLAKRFEISANVRESRPLVLQVNKLPKTISNGEVYHMPRIRLVLPVAGSNESTIAATNGSLHLPEYTVFVLRTAAEAAPTASAVPLASVRPTAEARHNIAPFLGACRSGACTTLSAALTPSARSLSLSSRQDLHALGFRQEHDRAVAELGFGATVHFLGEDEILITFPTHGLVPRDSAERPTDTPQPVRAVLLDAATLAVKRTETWTVDDHNAYAWALGHNLLVHDGRALHLYGPGLTTMATLPLELPLASVHPSPDGEHLLLGEIHELHTMADHRLLRGTDGQLPDEEIFWSLLDAHLNRVRSFGVTSSRVPAPTLRNEGLLELRRGHEGEWFLAGKGWEDPSEKLLGSLHSSCLPVLGELAPDLLTMRTCDALGSGTHTFVARSDGRPVVEQTSASQDLPISFTVAADASRIALLLTRADETYGRGLAFNLNTLHTQVLTVLSVGEGRLLGAVALPAISPYQSAFALSPHGDRLVVISGEHLLFFDLHA